MQMSRWRQKKEKKKNTEKGKRGGGEGSEFSKLRVSPSLFAFEGVGRFMQMRLCQK